MKERKMWQVGMQWRICGMNLMLREHLKGSFTWKHHDELYREEEREREREKG